MQGALAIPSLLFDCSILRRAFEACPLRHSVDLTEIDDFQNTTSEKRFGISTRSGSALVEARNMSVINSSTIVSGSEVSGCWRGRHYSDWALCAGAASCGRKCKCPQLQVWAANSLGATTISLHIVTITSGVFIPKSHPLWMETNLNPLNVMPSLLGHTKLILCCSSGARGQSVSARFLGFVWRLGVGYF